MKFPEKNFWRYVALLSSVLLVGFSGHLSCAHADTYDTPRAERHMMNEPAPWNQPGPFVDSQPHVSLRAQLDRHAVLRGGDGTVRIEVQIDAPGEGPNQPHAPSDIVVVVDTSGSMDGDKIYYAQKALMELFDRLEPSDRFALVEYSDSAHLLVPLTYANERAKEEFVNQTRRLNTTGSTNMSAGLDLGAQLLSSASNAGRSGRLLLLSDGLANMGDSTMNGLSRRAARLQSQGFALSTMGIGSDFDENIMTGLANAGAGAFYYLANLSYLPEFFEAELTNARQTYATAAELNFAPASGVRLVDAMGLPVDTFGGQQVVRIGNLYSRRPRSVWLTVQVPAYQLGPVDIGNLSLKYVRDSVAQHVTVGRLPEVVCLNDRARYQQQINQAVWERGLMNNVFSQTQESFGDGIRTGDTTRIKDALKSAEEERQLAAELGSQQVLDRMAELRVDADRASAAASAPAPVRNESAKKAKAQGFQSRNRANYDDVDLVQRAY